MKVRFSGEKKIFDTAVGENGKIDVTSPINIENNVYIGENAILAGFI